MSKNVTIFNKQTKELWRGRIVSETTRGFYVQQHKEKDTFTERSEWIPRESALMEVTHES